VIAGLQGVRKDVAVPKKPLHPLQLLSDVGGQLIQRTTPGLSYLQALGPAESSRDPHRDVEPVQQVLGPRS
jgi:hypothetical protein